MNVHSHKRPRALSGYLLVLVVLAGLLAGSVGPVLAAPATLSGTVSLAGSATPVTDAAVVATQGGATPAVVKSLTDGSGHYALTLTPGDWQIVVKAHESDPTVSPAWVYTGGIQAVTIPDTSTLDLSVSPATATLQGTLLPPAGSPAGTTFEGANAASVRAADQEGQGNSVQVKPDGSFSLNVLPGNVLVRLALKNPAWAPATTLAGSAWTLAAGETLTIAADPLSGANPLQLLEKQASISGAIKDELGHLVSGYAIPVRAWRLDGSEVAETLSDPVTGQYALAVVSGDWYVWAVPADDQPYVGVDSPQFVALLTPTAAKVQNLHVAAADVSVTGQVVDQNNQPVAGVNGRVIPTYLDKDGVHWRQFSQGARILNSAYTLKLSSSESSHYRLHASFNNLQGYTQIFAPLLTLAQGQSSYPNTNLPVAANNSSIQGQLVTQLGAPQTGVPGAIYGVSDGGAFARRRVNPLDASYEFDVAATDLNGNGGTFWWLHAFVDPSSGFAVIHPATRKVFLPSTGANLSGVDFTTAQLNATLQGTVSDPQGVPVKGAKVSVWEQNVEVGKAFTRWVETGPDGKYRLKVPAGTFKVGADAPRWTSPAAAIVSVAAGQSAAQDLQFRANNAWIVGKVSYNGAGHSAMIRAYTTDGGHAWTLADKNGIYALHVAAGLDWHVQAVSEDGADFLRSPRLNITPQACTLATGDCLSKNPLNLTLEQVDRLPGALVLRFDASQNQTFTLSDGAQVVIPANAMADSGFVTLVARPLPELADDGGVTPVSFGYRLLAFDDSQMPIETFNAPVTLVMPFTAAQLAELTVSPDNLVPQYWDLATSSFKPVPAYSVSVDSSGNGSLNLHVEHFTDYALTAGSNAALFTLGNHVFLPAVAH